MSSASSSPASGSSPTGPVLACQGREGGLIDTPRGPKRSPFVVFVRKSPGRSGATKVQIAERRDGRDVVLEHVGTAHDEAELAALVTVARCKLHPGEGELVLEGINTPAPAGGAAAGRAGTAVIPGKSNAVLWRVLRAGYRLGFEAVRDEAFAQLAHRRNLQCSRAPPTGAWNHDVRVTLPGGGD